MMMPHITSVLISTVSPSHDCERKFATLEPNDNYSSLLKALRFLLSLSATTYNRGAGSAIRSLLPARL